MCFYNARIYNVTIHKTPELIDVDKLMPKPSHNGLYQILLVMKYLRPTDDEWILFVNKLDNLIQKNNNVVSLNAMNFPLDWKEHLSV